MMIPMTDWPSGELTTARIVEVLRWLLFRDRPPGMPGPAVKITSHRNSNAALTRLDDGAWALMDNAGQAEARSIEDLVELVATRNFIPINVEIRPNLAPILFQEAVARTSDSVVKINEAHQELGDGEPDVMAFVLIGGLLDRSLRASFAGLVLAIASAEAQVNEWIETTGGWSGIQDRHGLMEKVLALMKRFSVAAQTGTGHLQDLQRSIDQRNNIIHSSPSPTTYSLTGADSLTPSRSASIDARRVCLAVRLSLIEISDVIGQPVPQHLQFLAYCPPGDPADDDLWTKAEVMTGVRDDPAFPPFAR